MIEHLQRHGHGVARTSAIIVSVFLIGSIALLWSWNTLAVDLFQLPKAQFKHAVAFALLITGAFALRLFVVRFSEGRTRRSSNRG